MTGSYALAFLVGLLAALHCLGMCGGILGALTFSLPYETRREWPRMLPFLLAYNLGRVASYAVAGAAFGWIGGALLAAGSNPWPHRVLQWLAALVLVGIGLYIAGWFPRFTEVERLGAPLWRRLEPLGRRLLPVTTLPRALIFGAIWGWLPCGLVYTMLSRPQPRAGPWRGPCTWPCSGSAPCRSCSRSGCWRGGCMTGPATGGSRSPRA